MREPISWQCEIEADEFGVCDGRVIAQEMVTEALRLILPYVEGEIGRAGSIMRALVMGAAEQIDRELKETGNVGWGVHVDKDLVEGEVLDAMRKHARATQDMTRALIERADLGEKKDQN